ncbi:MAG: hypothetical protein PHN56_03630 [Candidatus Nanoarchaeia archaeon]|nr:hypothetical protein [Candidatus Nanoarchaeia archaeon]
MNKGQVSILGVVILTGIVMGLVSVTYVWAGPLITKNIDKANVNSVISFMNNLNEDILYVASTGSSRVISASLGEASFIIDAENNQVIIEMSSSVPMINSVTESPINFHELATKRENFDTNASLIDSTTQLSGYDSTSYYSIVALAEGNYNASLFKNSTSSNFDLLCIWNSSITKLTDCANVGQTISVQGTTYEVVYINSTGSNALFIGGLVENKGIFGLEPSGILSGKGFNSNNKEYITLYLKYRGLVSDDNVDFKIFIDCSNNCAFSNENKNFVISRTNIVRGSGYVYTYINIEVD